MSRFALLLAVIEITCFDVATAKCRPDEFKCAEHGKCIGLKYRCNGYDDCGDNSDEITTNCLYDNSIPSNSNSSRPTRSARMTQQEIEDQDAELQTYLTTLKLGMLPPPDLKSSVRLQLLWLCTGVFQKLTKGQILPDSVTTDGFAKFYKIAGNHTGRWDVDEKRYSVIKNVLTECSKKELTFVRVGKGCPKWMSFITSPIVKMATSVKFDPHAHDLIVELFWKVFSFVHTICFPDFANELNLHHVLETQIESLFLTPEVQERWFRKTGGYSRMEHLISTSKMDQRMEHLDGALRDAFDYTVYKKWLGRPKAEDL